MTGVARRTRADELLDVLRDFEDAPCADDLERLAGEGEPLRADPEEDRWLGWCAVTGPLERWHPNPEEALLADESAEKLLDSLTARRRRIVQTWLGLDGGPPRCHSELAELDGISRTRIGQLLAKACRRMLLRARAEGLVPPDAEERRRSGYRPGFAGLGAHRPSREPLQRDVGESAALAREVLAACGAHAAVIGTHAIIAHLPGHWAGWRQPAPLLRLAVRPEDIARIRRWLRDHFIPTKRHGSGGLRASDGAAQVEFAGHSGSGGTGLRQASRVLVQNAYRTGRTATFGGVPLPVASRVYVVFAALFVRAPGDVNDLLHLLRWLRDAEVSRLRALGSLYLDESEASRLDHLIARAGHPT